MSLLSALAPGPGPARPRPEHLWPPRKAWRVGFMTETLTACQLLQGGSAREPRLTRLPRLLASPVGHS